MAEVTQAATHIGSVVDLADNSTQVYGSPVQLVGVHVQSTISAHAVLIKDGGTSGTTKFQVPASTAGGTWIEGGNMRFDTDLTVDPDDTGTGTITVVYTPIMDGLVGTGAGLP